MWNCASWEPPTWSVASQDKPLRLLVSSQDVVSMLRVSARNGVGVETPIGDPADLWRFVVWLVEAGETEALTTDHVWNLYLEFVEYTDTLPLTAGRLFKRLGDAGVVRYRQGTGRRQWLYRIGPAAALSVSDRPWADVRAGRRR
jgi:hypothetical protein